MSAEEVIAWLLKGDVSLQYQVCRDLLGKNRTELRRRIQHEVWGKRFLSYRSKNGHWGRGFYQPKWTSSHYTLLDLRNLNIEPGIPEIRKTIELILDQEKAIDAGLNPNAAIMNSDVCINGMALNYSSYL